jgi:hypothetical protein
MPYGFATKHLEDFATESSGEGHKITQNGEDGVGDECCRWGGLV